MVGHKYCREIKDGLQELNGIASTAMEEAYSLILDNKSNEAFELLKEKRQEYTISIRTFDKRLDEISVELGM